MVRRQSALGLTSPRNRSVEHNSHIFASTGRTHNDVPPLQPPPQQSKSSNNVANSTKQQLERKKNFIRPIMASVTTEWTDVDLDRQYDLTPVADKKPGSSKPKTPSYTIDPFEFSPCSTPINVQDVASPHPDSSNKDDNKIASSLVDEEDFLPEIKRTASTFIIPEDIHPNMENKEEDILRLRLLAGKLSADWGAPDFMAPALARRIRDFQFAQDKRRKKYGDERPWGILGLYDHLSTIRIDVEWAEDAARRRANGESYLSWAEFDESKKGGRNRPYFTYCLLFVCAAVMIASIAVNGWMIEPLNENPMIGPSAETLIILGAKDSQLIVIHNEYWRLVTSSFLHAGLVHYLINMLALWFVGGAIEMSHGWFAAMIIYFLSAIGGSILSAILLPGYITVGASGGIFGFIGACLADIIMNWRLLFSDFVNGNGKKHRHVVILIVLVLDIALNCIIGLTPYVDNYNHLGGMFYGFLCGLSTIERLSADFFGLEHGFMNRAKQLFVRSLGLTVTVVFIVATLIVLLNSDGTTTPCPSCTWISCVPFPPWEDEANKWWYCDDCGRVTADVLVQPTPHLDMFCPSGSNVTVDLSDADAIDRDELKNNLPTYCRMYCPNHQ